MEFVISALVIIICTVKVISYGIYTAKDDNKTGAVGLFVLALAVVATAIPTFMK